MDADNQLCLISSQTEINGRVTGDQQLAVEGTVEGAISLDNKLSVRESGEIIAEIEAHSVVVEGIVDGDIVADDLVVLVAGCEVTGNIRTPRIEIEEEAEFKGNIDMDVSLSETE